MLTKLPLPAVIGVFLLTATIAVASTTTTGTRTRTSTRTTTVKDIAIVNSTSTTPSGGNNVTTVTAVTRNGDERNRRGSSRKDFRTITVTAHKPFAGRSKADLEDVRRTETTTSLLPLQPPSNLTRTTTSTFLTPSDATSSTASRRRVKKHQLSILAPQPATHSQSQAKTNTSTTTQTSSVIHALGLSNVNVENDNNTMTQHDDTKKVFPTLILPASDVQINKQDSLENSGTDRKDPIPNSNDYIHFDIRDDDESLRATAQPTRGSRMETVNEVLSNLFPNGFTDIFRFSYASEQPNPANIVTQEEKRVQSPARTKKPNVTETKITVMPSSTTTTTSIGTSTEKSRKSRAKTIFSVEKSISKEYRRELAPGHTEIVVEKLEKLPRRPKPGSGVFNDDSNVITKDDLLSINRAAVDSPVLPSMLVDPKPENETTNAERTKAIKQAPIIILNDDDSADMEGISAEDNLIAESQNVGQRFYQRLPAGDKQPYGYKLNTPGNPESDVSIRIVHHDSQPEMGPIINQRPIYVPDVQQLVKDANDDEAAEAKMRTMAKAMPTQQLDNFQEHAEQSFHQRNMLQEAPSRKFLRNFNPVLSERVGNFTQRGTFHYEANGLQPTFHVRAVTEMSASKQSKDSEKDGGKMDNAALVEGAEEAQNEVNEQNLRLPAHNYDNEAAQLRYFREQQYLQHQQQLLQQKQQLLLQQQQQEQQRLLQKSVIKQHQEQQRQEKTQQLQQQHQHQQQQLQLQQQHQQQQQQQQQEQQNQKQQQQKQQKQQQQEQKQQQKEQKQQQEQQNQEQQQQQKSQQQSLKEQYFFKAAPNYHEQQLQHIQKFHEHLQNEPPPQRQYTLFQQHPPPHEYKQPQQEKRQHELYYRQQQMMEEEEKARKQKQQEEQRKKQEDQMQQRVVQKQQTEQKPQAPPRDSEPAPASFDHHSYHYPLVAAQPRHRAPATPTPHSVVFVTLHTPSPQAHAPSSAMMHTSPHEYVTQAAASVIPQATPAAQEPKVPQTSPELQSTPAAILKRPQGGYTFVEVQKSLNIHNKLITEKDGKLVEEHETIYPMPHQYTPQYQQMIKVEPQMTPSPPQPQYIYHQYQLAQPQLAQPQPSQRAQSTPKPPQPQPAEPQVPLSEQPKPQSTQTEMPQMQKSVPEASKPAAAQPADQAEAPHAYHPHQHAQHLSLEEGGVHPNDYYFVPNEYLSLSSNPINVQHIDEPEQQEEASSFAHLQHVLPLQQHLDVYAQAEAHAAHAQAEAHAPHLQPDLHTAHALHHPHQYVQYIHHYQKPEEQTQQQQQNHQTQQQQSSPQPAPSEKPQQASVQASAQASENLVQHTTAESHEAHPPAAAENEGGEKAGEHPARIYIDRPYTVHEIVETHVPIPYPVPEPVPVPVHVDRYIDRPYPVEKIVEKRVPYPVEKVVEKIVEKEIPIEVEKVVEKVVNRPVPIPIRVPVAIPVPYAQQPSHEYDKHAGLYGSPYNAYPNALRGWAEPPVGPADFGRGQLAQQIPPKVLQNYYARMLKKLLPQALAQRGLSSAASTGVGPTFTHTQARPKSPTPSSIKATKSQKSVTPSSSTTPKQISFKIGDMRFDLKPPPPPPTGPEWSKGSRYIYNTLPRDLSVADTSDSEQLTDAYSGPSFASSGEPYDEFQRWRNGHNLKRSPQFGRSVQIEYGFKPPLVPSVEINDQGIPLSADAKKDEK